MKKWFAWILVLTLLLSVTGCKSAIGEDGATAGEYVEGEEQQMSGDSPDKVTDLVVIDPSGTTQNPSNQKPNDQREETSDAEQPEDDRQQTSDPSEEEENKQENTTPEQKPEEDEENELPPATLKPGSKPTVTVDPEADELKIISYNVRCKNDSGGNKISERSVRFKKVMDQYDPDIMGLQEVVPEWMTYLERDFSSSYGHVNQWRAESDQEGTPIFWKKDKFTLLESGHFWLSDTPDVESKAESWGAEYYRICMWVKLQVKATGKVFLFYNTHFDTAKEPRVPSAELIIKRATEEGGFKNHAVFCSGDFNMRTSHPAYDTLYTHFKDVNRELENLKTPTSNGYHKEGQEGYLIDYCFYTPEKSEPLKYQVIDEYVDDGYVSDHCGLYIEAKLL